ncbi:MAG: hypothetical protein Q7K39_04570 [Candidatus Magasanikbacteria bacterium]|nr:hypothetical protein [Candidatus Magasanikbacteria bacterium]
MEVANAATAPKLPGSWELFKSSWQTLLNNRNLFAWPIVIVFLIDFVFGIAEYFTASPAMMLASWLVGKLAEIWVLVVIAKIIKDLHSKTGATTNYMQAALALLPVATVTAVIMGLLNGLLYFALIVPGIIFSFYWAFTLFALAVTDKKYKAAMNYSKYLVKGRAAVLFGYMLFFAIVGGLIALLLVAPVLLIAGTFEQNLLVEYLNNNLAAGVYVLAIAEIFTAFGLIYTAKLYLAFEETKPAVTATPVVKV